jgi:hypothetical protein
MASEAAADIERFHRVPIEDEIKRRGIELKLQGAEIVEPCPVCEQCSICGCGLCATPGFCRMCRKVDRKAAERRCRPVNNRSPTPQTVIEAVMYCVRARGLGALKEQPNLDRLRQCDATAQTEIDRRIDKLFELGILEK